MSTDDPIDFERLAAAVVAAGEPRPTVLHARRVPSYEVELEALEIVREQPLSATDRAALGLVAALGVATSADVATYLGLGSTLSALLLLRLTRDRLIEPVDSNTLLRTLFFWKSERRLETRANRVDPLHPASSLQPERHSLTDAGRETLQTNVRRIAHTRSACLIFWAEPLHFIQVLEKARKKYAKTREAPTLQPEAVPRSLSVIDELLRKPIEERERMIGLGKKIKNIDGEIVRCVPGSQWTVRPSRAERLNLLVVTGTPEWEGGPLAWTTWTGTDERLAPTPRLDLEAIALREPGLRFDPGEVIAAIPGGQLSYPTTTRDGAVRARCAASTLIQLLGAKAHPIDAWAVLPLTSALWSSAVRVRANPDSEPAAHLALLEILGRRTTAMLADLDGAVVDAWRDLCAYWGDPPLSPPERRWLLDALWDRPALRAPVCRRRLDEDLVAAYAIPAEVR